MKRTFGLLFLFSLLFSLSCRKRDIAVPSYICIPEFSVVTGTGEGTNRQSFEYITVFVNDNPIGTFEVPGTFPVLHEGLKEIKIRPVIKELAREGYIGYNMFDIYTTSVDLKADETDTLRPVFKYANSRVFAWLEDFNDSSASMSVKYGTIDTFFIQNDLAKSVDSTPYCYIPMGSGQTFFEIETDDDFSLPWQQDVYLEIDYKTNIPFTIGVYAHTATQVVPIPSVTPFETDKWRKAYVQLRDEVTSQTANTRFSIYFRSANGESIQPEIFIDNLKLVYRN